MAERKQRSDAQQNRERILVVAKEAFAKSGANASLDDIARQAGVGPGTLYRHFPSREDLLKAVYQAAADKLGTAATEFAETLPPIDASIASRYTCRTRLSVEQPFDCQVSDRGREHSSPPPQIDPGREQEESRRFRGFISG